MGKPNVSGGLVTAVITAVSISPVLIACSAEPPAARTGPTIVELGPVPEGGGMSLNEALRRRRSIREFDGSPLNVSDLGTLLWATQGVTSEWGGRTAPSAGAIYPLEIYVATAQGVLHYLPALHAVEIVSAEDVRPALHVAALSQEAVARAPAVFVVASDPSRTAEAYGSRAERYVILEAGHAAQNLLLEVAALELAAVPIGAFDDDAVVDALRLSADQMPLYLIPVGSPGEG